MNIKLLTYTDIPLEELYLDGICVLSQKLLSANSILEQIVCFHTSGPIIYDHELVTQKEFELCADEYYE